MDIALRVRMRLDDSGSLVVKKLGPTSTLLVASPQLLQRSGAPRGVEELDHLPTVAMSTGDGRVAWQLQGPAGEEFVLQHRPVYAADDMLTLKFAMLQGSGMGLLPDYMCREEVRRGELVPVLPGWTPAAAMVLAVFPSRRGMVPAVRCFLDFLAENLQGDRIAGTD